MKYLKLWENFNKEIIISVKNENENEIKVFIDEIKELVGFVGDGVYDINYDSLNLSGKWKGFNEDEYQNEVNIHFEENAWGGIDLEEWKKLESILDKYVDNGQLQDFNLNTSHNNITLVFDSDYQMGIY